MTPGRRRRQSGSWSTVVYVVPTMLLVFMVGYANWQDARRSRQTALAPLVERAERSTSRSALRDRIRTLEAKVVVDPGDARAALPLAAALLRQARVESEGTHAVRAEAVLRGVLADAPTSYQARRMLGVVYLAQHRFRRAIQEAERCRAIHPDDAANYGTLGDAYLELGRYREAFDAFQRMMDLRPNAAAYARAAYALELQGDLEGALELMTMAAGSTSAHDLEAQAWCYAQLGHLHFERGRLDEARQHYERARFTFPAHPYALEGIARVTAAEGDLMGALRLHRKLFQIAETPEVAARIGDLEHALGNEIAAEVHYRLAERLEREGWQVEAPQPAALARFLAERDRDIGEAVRLAEAAAAERQDIFTLDALAWAYFKDGRLADARAASERARRTDTRDRRILFHAAAIEHAHERHATARTLLEAALEDNPRFDVVAAHRAARLLGELAARAGEAMTRHADDRRRSVRRRVEGSPPASAPASMAGQKMAASAASRSG